jgi:dTDP-4-amino-4,6-dideoxygalactose transaminase
MQVPFIDLKRQYEPIRTEVQKVIEEVVQSQKFILGEAVRELEERVAKFCATAYAVGCASGTDALLLSLMACDVGRDDEVITTPFSFFATAGVIARLGARPVFADIRPGTFNIDPDGIEKKITERTRAILPVHIFGQCADMDPIRDVARRHGLKVIEDAAQAIGATYKGRKAGSMGDTGCFSFFPTKNLGGFGDGGMVTTNDEHLARRIGSLRVHGSRDRYHHTEVGLNSRLDALQAAILLVKLKYLEGWSDKRIENAGFYGESLRDLPVKTPRIQSWNRCIFNQYTLRVIERDRFREYLKDRGVPTAIYYPVPLHLQPCFADLGHRPGDLPAAEEACREAVSLPIFPELRPDELSHVVASIRAFDFQ